MKSCTTDKDLFLTKTDHIPIVFEYNLGFVKKLKKFIKKKPTNKKSINRSLIGEHAEDLAKSMDSSLLQLQNSENEWPDDPVLFTTQVKNVLKDIFEFTKSKP